MKLDYLEGFRGYLSVWVFLFHGYGFLPKLFKESFLFNLFHNGLLPVIGFIVLSGFVTHILLEKQEKFLFYIKRRFLRLFPIYLVGFIISLVMLQFSLQVLENMPFENSKINMRIGLINAYNNNPDKLLNILSHLTLTHGLFPNEKFPFGFTIMGQAWSLTLEWQFYLFIPILYGFLQRKKLLINGSLLLAFILLTIFTYNHMKQISFLPNMILYFLIGYFSYPLYKSFAANKNYYLFIYLAIVSILAYFIISSKISMIFVAWMLVLYFQKNKNKISWFFLGSKFSQFLGKISYSVYCLHMIVLYLVAGMLQYFNVENEIYYSILVIAISTILVLILSNYTYKYIELYFIKMGRSKPSPFSPQNQNK